MAKIFISYRRQDSADVVGRIYDYLEKPFGNRNLFMDVDSIPRGVDFRKHLHQAITGCDIVLVVIGPAWLEAADADGRRRLDDPADFVRIEVEETLEHGRTIVPVLIRGAGMPRVEQLPAPLKELAFRNAAVVRPDPDFRRDVERLIHDIEQISTKPPADSPAPSQPIQGTVGASPTLGQGVETKDAGDWIGAQLKGRYSILRLLGQGGMGVVYLADDCNLRGDQVVVKRPHAHLLADPAASARFLQEVQLLIQLRHPHICHVRDAGEHGGIPFVVMDYLAGGSLLERCRKGPDGRPEPMSAEEVLPWLGDVAKALDFVHGKGHVHRDVKPSNILFDAEGNAFLTDFGIVKALVQTGQSKGITQVGTFIGTPEYTAPEVFAGGVYDGRVDQYALAIILYELLAGQRPFEGPTPFAIAVKQAANEPSGIQGVPESVSRAVLKALSRSPAARYGTCAEFLRAVDQRPTIPAPSMVELKARPTPSQPPAIPRPAAPLPCSQIIPPKPLEVITNSIGMKLVLIPAGEFLMG